jgi:hypothetical protein
VTLLATDTSSSGNSAALLVGLLIALAAGIAVGVDAQRRYGTVNWLWGVLTFLVLIIGLPAYIIYRFARKPTRGPGAMTYDGPPPGGYPWYPPSGYPPPGYAPPPAVGQISPDGAYRWDGTSWAPTAPPQEKG